MADSTATYPDHIPKVLPSHQMNAIGKIHSIDELSPRQSSHFPEDLPMRPPPPPRAAAAPWTQRMQGFWTFSLSSYSIIHTPDGAARVRHIAMITIIALRTAMSALSVLSVVVKWNVGGIVLYSLLALLTFWFTATCLAIIGDAKGHAKFKRIIVVGYIPLLHPWLPE